MDYYTSSLKKKNYAFCIVGIFFHVNQEKFKSFTEGHSYLTTKAKRFFWKKKHLPCIFNVRVKIIFGIFHRAVIGSRQKLVLFPNQIYPSLSAWLWNIECLIKSRFSFHLWDKDWILKVYSSWTTSKTSMALTFVLGCLNYTDWFEVERNILKPNHLHS